MTPIRQPRAGGGTIIEGPRPQQITVLVVLLALLPALASLPGLFGAPYAPGSDHVLLELGARRASRAVLELGPYSRYGWFHPGPAIYYLLAGPYLLTGRDSAGILLAAVIVNGAALTLIAVTVCRQAGALAAVGSLAVLLVVLRALPVDILADPWNPYLPILGLVLLTVLAWRAVAGRHQLLPALPVLASLCVQTHVGFLLPCVGVLAATALLLLVRRTRPRVGVTRWTAWAAVFVLIWLPPIWQQITGRQGNLSALWGYFSEAHQTQTWTESFRLVATELGRFPAYLLHVRPRPMHLTSPVFAPPVLPLWTTVVTLVCFGVIVLLAARRRQRTVLELAALTVVVSLTALLAVQQVSGFLFEYIVQWTSLSGALAWITILVGSTSIVRATTSSREAREPREAREAVRVRRMIVAIGGGCVVLVAVLGLLLGVAAGRVRPDNEPDAPPVAAQLVHWLGGRPRGVVGMSYLPCLQPSLLCTLPVGSAVIGQLVRHGVPTQPLDFDRRYFGPVLPPAHGPVTYPLLLGFTPGGSPKPPPPWRPVAGNGDVVVYARG